MHACVLSHVQFLATPWTVASRLLHPWDFPGKNTGVDYHFLLQGIFPTQGRNSSLLRWQVGTAPPGKHTFLKIHIFIAFISAPKSDEKMEVVGRITRLTPFDLRMMMSHVLV